MKKHPKQPPGTDRQANKEPDPPSLEKDVEGAGSASGDVPPEKDDIAWAPESGDKPEAAVPPRRPSRT